MTAEEIRRKLAELGNKQKSKVLQGFFKTGPGQYGEGDVFLGITVPILRKLAIQYSETHLAECVNLLKSTVHEERLLALFLLIRSFEKGGQTLRARIYSLYLRKTAYINNWDLVDLSAPKIIGPYLQDKAREPLYRLAASSDLWERRISILATLHFIRDNEFVDTLRISRILLGDEHDLIHKAVGWMLREVGKRDMRTEEEFLLVNYKKMPRTMLRYAIERFPESRRRAYLNGSL